MKEKCWYKIEVNKSGDSTYHYTGSSSLSFDAIAEKIKNGDFIRLDELLYMERGEMKEWATWDKSLVPSVLIQPTCVVSIMQFKGDPREIPIK